MATAQELIDAATREIGTTERPAGSNRQPYAAAAGHANGYAWCASFVVAMARSVGLKLPSESAYTPTMANGFKAAGRWYGRYSGAPGDIAFFDFPDRTMRIQHVGIVVSVIGDYVTCVEGNTSSGSSGSQDNGGGVFRRVRPLSHVVGFGRPDFVAAPIPVRPVEGNLHVMELEKVIGWPLTGLWTPQLAEACRVFPVKRGTTGPVVRFVQKKLTEAGFPTKVDGVFGHATEKAVKGFQRANRLDTDGVVGPKTMKRLVRL